MLQQSHWSFHDLTLIFNFRLETYSMQVHRCLVEWINEWMNAWLMQICSLSAHIRNLSSQVTEFVIQVSSYALVDFDLLNLCICYSKRKNWMLKKSISANFHFNTPCGDPDIVSEIEYFPTKILCEKLYANRV